MWSNFGVKTHLGPKNVFEGKILDIGQYLAFEKNIFLLCHTFFSFCRDYTVYDGGRPSIFLSVGFVILFSISSTELLLYTKVE